MIRIASKSATISISKQLVLSMMLQKALGIKNYRSSPIRPILSTISNICITSKNSLSGECNWHPLQCSMSLGHDLYQIILNIFIIKTLQQQGTRMDNKKFMINPILYKSMETIIKKDPNADEDRIFDQITKQNNISMKKQTIRIAIKHFLKRKQDSKPNQVLTVTESSGMNVMRKKVKRADIEIQFQDKEHYRFQNMGGISQTLAEINSYLINPQQNVTTLQQLGIQPIKGFILAGPIGSGKTLLGMTILSHLKNKLGCTCYFVNMGSLLGSDAEQKMKKIFEAAVENQPSAIMFDDIDFICQKDASKRPQGSPISCFITEVDKLKQLNVVLLATSSAPEKLDITLKKLNRFEKTISISSTSDQCRYEILSKLLQKIRNQLSSDEIKQLSQLTSGYMAADLEMLLKEAGVQAINNSQTILTFPTIKNALKFIQPILKKEGFTDIPTTTLDDVGGLDQLKVQLEREIIVPIRQQAKFKEMNFDIQSGGVLLYGPPGCGKTMLAKAIANAVRANFIIVKGPQLLNKYVGESEQAVRQVFGRAQRAAPCVIFFDQFDALAPKRSDQGNQVTERVVNTLLTALDGVEQRKMVFVIAATNRKDMIDEATLRSGRIQKHLYVPQPDAKERIQILKAITKSINIQPSIDFSLISEQTNGFSGADLRFLVKQAVVSAVTDNRNSISKQDLEKSLKELLADRNIEKVMEKDKTQNEKFEFKGRINRKNNGNIEIEENKEKQQRKGNQKGGIIEEFMEFLQKKMRNRPS